MSCPAPGLLQRLLLDDLPPDQQATLWAHVESCPTCKTELQALDVTLSLEVKERLRPPADSLMRASEQAPQTRRRTRPRPSRVSRRLERERASTSALLAPLLGGLVVCGVLAGVAWLVWPRGATVAELPHLSVATGSAGGPIELPPASAEERTHGELEVALLELERWQGEPDQDPHEVFRRWTRFAERARGTAYAELAALKLQQAQRACVQHVFSSIDRHWRLGLAAKDHVAFAALLDEHEREAGVHPGVKARVAHYRGQLEGLVRRRKAGRFVAGYRIVNGKTPQERVQSIGGARVSGQGIGLHPKLPHLILSVPGQSVLQVDIDLPQALPQAWLEVGHTATTSGLGLDRSPITIWVNGRMVVAHYDSGAQTGSEFPVGPLAAGTQRIQIRLDADALTVQWVHGLTLRDVSVR